MALLSCENLVMNYDGHIVLSELTFEVNAGDYLCIVGENGSGKSTLIKGLLGLKKPSEGTIQTGDGLNPNEIGYLPQQTDIQKDFPASVYEVVLSGCLNGNGMSPFYSSKSKKLAKENMEKLGITKFKKRCYRELSGGQQQRVLLARALCATKKLLLLDEPVAGLDPIVTNEMYDLINKLNKEDGITIIMVSHDIGAAVNYANRILHLHAKPLFFGETKDYVNGDIGKMFLGGNHSDK